MQKVVLEILNLVSVMYYVDSLFSKNRMKLTENHVEVYLEFTNVVLISLFKQSRLKYF